jgi:hypothetical protein
VVKRVTSEAEVTLFHFRKASQGGKEVRTAEREAKAGRPRA